MPYESRLERKRELCDLRRVPPDTKDPRLCRLPRNGIVGHLQEPPDKVKTTLTPITTGSCVPPLLGGDPAAAHPLHPPPQVPDVGLRDELPSDESLSESGTSQHFASKGVLGGRHTWQGGGHQGGPPPNPSTDASPCASSLRVTDADPGQWDWDLPAP